MNVVDSSGWLEYLAEEPNADFFAAAIEHTAELIVPSLSVYEVFKRISQQRDEHTALKATALMMQGQVIHLDISILNNTTIPVRTRRISTEIADHHAKETIL